MICKQTNAYTCIQRKRKKKKRRKQENAKAKKEKKKNKKKILLIEREKRVTLHNQCREKTRWANNMYMCIMDFIALDESVCVCGMVRVCVCTIVNVLVVIIQGEI